MLLFLASLYLLILHFTSHYLLIPYTYISPSYQNSNLLPHIFPYPTLSTSCLSLSTLHPLLPILHTCICFSSQYPQLLHPYIFYLILPTSLPHPSTPCILYPRILHTCICFSSQYSHLLLPRIFYFTLPLSPIHNPPPCILYPHILHSFICFSSQLSHLLIVNKRR